MPKLQSSPSAISLSLGLLTIYLIWGSTYLAIRIAVETLPPFLMAAARFLVAGCILLSFLAVTKGIRISSSQWRENSIISAFLLLGGNGLVSWAEEEVPSGIATLVISLNPLFMVLGDLAAFHIFRDGIRGSKPSGWTFVGLAFGFLGFGMLVGPSLTANDATKLDFWRIAALVTACLSWCIGSLVTRYSRDPVEPFTGSAIKMLCGGLWLLVASLLLAEPMRFHWSSVTFYSFAAWLYLVIAGSLVAFTTYVWLMKHLSPAIVSTTSYVNPIVAVLLGWLVLNESISPRIFLAAATIILGIAIITYSKARIARI